MNYNISPNVEPKEKKITVYGISIKLGTTKQGMFSSFQEEVKVYFLSLNKRDHVYNELCDNLRSEKVFVSTGKGFVRGEMISSVTLISETVNQSYYDRYFTESCEENNETVACEE